MPYSRVQLPLPASGCKMYTAVTKVVIIRHLYLAGALSRLKAFVSESRHPCNTFAHFGRPHVSIAAVTLVVPTESSFHAERLKYVHVKYVLNLRVAVSSVYIHKHLPCPMHQWSGPLLSRQAAFIFQGGLFIRVHGYMANRDGSIKHVVGPYDVP